MDKQPAAPLASDAEHPVLITPAEQDKIPKPIQVTITDFLRMAGKHPDIRGIPTIWSQWPQTPEDENLEKCDATVVLWEGAGAEQNAAELLKKIMAKYLIEDEKLLNEIYQFLKGKE